MPRGTRTEATGTIQRIDLDADNYR